MESRPKDGWKLILITEKGDDLTIVGELEDLRAGIETFLSRKRVLCGMILNEDGVWFDKYGGDWDVLKWAGLV